MAQITLTDRVYRCLIDDDCASDAHRDGLPTSQRGQMSIGEMDYHDFALCIGVAYGIARGEDPFETDRSVAERAAVAGRDAFFRWSEFNMTYSEYRASHPLTEDCRRAGRGAGLMANVTIRSEETRDVLMRALWHAAAEALGNNENEGAWLDNTSEELNESRVRVDARVAAYREVVDELEATCAAEVGDIVSIETEIGVWIVGLRNVLTENPGDLLNADIQQRDRMLRLYDAAYELLPAEAVA